MKTKSPKRPHFVEDPPVKSVFIDEYEVFFTPFQNWESALSPLNRKTYLSLLEEAQTHPQQTLSKVLAFKESCPSSPEVDNLLTYLHVQNKQVLQAEALIEESFKKYPDYFFAKINYADQELRKKQYHKLLEIFPSSELKNNCRSRTKYHVTEYRSFMALMSRYYLAIGQKERAIFYYKKAHQADPAHISVIALESKLFRLLWIKRLFQRTCKLLSRGT